MFHRRAGERGVQNVIKLIVDAFLSTTFVVQHDSDKFGRNSKKLWQRIFAHSEISLTPGHRSEKNDRYYQIKLNIGGSITVKLTFVLVCLDSAALLMFNEQLYLCGQIQTSTTGGQLYSETSPMVSVLRLFITYGRFHILKLISFWVSEMP